MVRWSDRNEKIEFVLALFGFSRNELHYRIFGKVDIKYWRHTTLQSLYCQWIISLESCITVLYINSSFRLVRPYNLSLASLHTLQVVVIFVLNEFISDQIGYELKQVLKKYYQPHQSNLIKSLSKKLVVHSWLENINLILDNNSRIIFQKIIWSMKHVVSSSIVP